MKIRVPVIPIQKINGQLVIHNASNAADADPVLTARLKKEGKLEELKALEETEMFLEYEDYELTDDLIIIDDEK